MVALGFVADNWLNVVELIWAPNSDLNSDSWSAPTLTQ